MLRVLLQTVFSKLSKKERIFLCLGVFFLCLVIFDKLLFLPLYDKLKILDEKINNQKARVKENLQLIAYKEKITKDIQNYSSYMEEERLSSEEEMASFLKKIESQAAEFSISLANIKPLPLEDEKGAKKYSVSLEGKAKINQVADFIYKIESPPPLIVVEKFSIKLQNPTEPEVLNFTMVVSRIIVRKITLQ